MPFLPGETKNYITKQTNCSLCEFFKFTRAAKNGIERGRRYKPRETSVETCDNCGGRRGATDWKVGSSLFWELQASCLEF